MSFILNLCNGACDGSALGLPPICRLFAYARYKGRAEAGGQDSNTPRSISRASAVSASLSCEERQLYGGCLTIFGEASSLSCLVLLFVANPFIYTLFPFKTASCVLIHMAVLLHSFTVVPGLLIAFFSDFTGGFIIFISYSQPHFGAASSVSAESALRMAVYRIPCAVEGNP